MGCADSRDELVVSEDKQNRNEFAAVHPDTSNTERTDRPVLPLPNSQRTTVKSITPTPPLVRRETPDNRPVMDADDVASQYSERSCRSASYRATPSSFEDMDADEETDEEEEDSDLEDEPSGRNIPTRFRHPLLRAASKTQMTSSSPHRSPIGNPLSAQSRKSSIVVTHSCGATPIADSMAFPVGASLSRNASGSQEMIKPPTPSPSSASHRSRGRSQPQPMFEMEEAMDEAACDDGDDDEDEAVSMQFSSMPSTVPRGGGSLCSPLLDSTDDEKRWCILYESAIASLTSSTQRMARVLLPLRVNTLGGSRSEAHMDSPISAKEKCDVSENLQLMCGDNVTTVSSKEHTAKNTRDNRSDSMPLLVKSGTINKIRSLKPLCQACGDSIRELLELRKKSIENVQYRVGSERSKTEQDSSPPSFGFGADHLTAMAKLNGAIECASIDFVYSTEMQDSSFVAQCEHNEELLSRMCLDLQQLMVCLDRR